MDDFQSCCLFYKQKLGGYVAVNSRNTLRKADLSKIEDHTCSTAVICSQSVDLISAQTLSPHLPHMGKHTSSYGPIISGIQPRSPFLK